MQDRLNRWEKAALFTVGSASAFNVLLWALGAPLAQAAPGVSWLGVPRIVFALLSFIGLDLTIVVTVMAQRDGRRGPWAWLTSTAAMLAAGGMALDVAQVVHWPALHAAPVAVLWCFMHHLAAPKVAQVGAVVARPSPVMAQRRRLVRRLVAALRTARATVAHALAQVAQRDDELAQVRAMLAQPRLIDGAETVTIGAQSYSVRQIAEMTDTPLTTLRRRLAQATKEAA